MWLACYTQDEIAQAATLSGYVSEASNTIGAGPIPISEAIYEEGQEAIRRALTADEIESAWTAGQGMTLDEAVEEALLVGAEFQGSSAEFE